MSWYDPTSWGDTAKNILNAISPVTALYGGTQGSVAGKLTGNPAQDDEIRRRQMLYAQAQQAGNFADQGQTGYTALEGRGTSALDWLERQAMGQNSVAGEQLRQGLQQNVAAQQAFAAGASPRNAAMAARTAAIQSGRLGAGLAGQQALAGLQERNQAQMAFGNLLQGLRGQDLQATLGSRQQALGAYSPQNVGQPQQSWLQQYGPMIMDVGKYAVAASDRRLKTDVKDGDAAANKAAEQVGAHMFRYRDQRRFGKGERLGIMAQGLEDAGLGHAVINTPEGKMVHGAQLATANTAMVGALARRLAKLEAKKAA